MLGFFPWWKLEITFFFNKIFEGYTSTIVYVLLQIAEMWYYHSHSVKIVTIVSLLKYSIRC